jgi:hypothetical protein
MKIKNFINQRIPAQLKKPIRTDVCGVCYEYLECFDVLKGTFTNLDEVGTGVFCKQCAALFSTDWLKTAFYITLTGMYKLKQAEFEELLFNGKIEFPCILSFSSSRKKHRLYRSNISYHPRCVYISLDSGDVILDLKKDKKIFGSLKKLYSFNISKEWIKTGEYPAKALVIMGLQEFMKLENELKKHRGTKKFNLLVDFLNK